MTTDEYGHEDIGTIDIDAGTDLGEGDYLESIDFHVQVEASLADEEQDIVELAVDICHVHSSLQGKLHGQTTIEPGV